MQYQKLTEDQKEIASDRRWVWGRATQLQSEAESKGIVLTRLNAVRQAWAERYGRPTPAPVDRKPPPPIVPKRNKQKLAQQEARRQQEAKRDAAREARFAAYRAQKAGASATNSHRKTPA